MVDSEARSVAPSTSRERNPPVPMTSRDADSSEPTRKSLSHSPSVARAVAAVTKVVAGATPHRLDHRGIGLRWRRGHPGRPAHLRAPSASTAPRRSPPSPRRTPSGVQRRRRSCPPRSWSSQVRSVVDDFDVAAVKTGMLGDARRRRGGRRTRARGTPPPPRRRPGARLLDATTRSWATAASSAYREALCPAGRGRHPQSARGRDALRRRRARRHRRATTWIELARELLALGSALRARQGWPLRRRAARRTPRRPTSCVSAEDVIVFERRAGRHHQRPRHRVQSVGRALRRARPRSRRARRHARRQVLRARRPRGRDATGNSADGRGPLDHLGWNE